jgi:CheY-like chemotaxis protein
MATLLCESLADDYEVVAAGNGKDALQLLGTRKFDIILSDLMMPGKVQGLDFLEVAMNQQPEAKRILMSGYLNPQLMERSVSLVKLSRVLIKPIDITQLRQELRDVLAS